MDRLAQIWTDGIFAQSNGSFWMPPQASTNASEVDFVFNFILWISVFFFLLIVGLMAAFVLLYRRREGYEPQPSPNHSNTLELIWTLIPIIIVIVIFYFGFKTYLNTKVAPANAMNIYVTGQKWDWFFKYPNGFVDNNLHAPIDRPVKLIITSDDVTHSLFIPAFRLKMDAVPGRYTTAWFQAKDVGTYPLLCAEYCGTGHSDMLATVEVHEPGGYETWLEKASNIHNEMSPAEAGKYLVVKRCTSCHTVDGTAHTGPTFKGLFGKNEMLKGGSTALVDENYTRESILEPGVKIVEGYGNVMPTFKGKLTDQDIMAIIEYMRTMKSEE